MHREGELAEEPGGSLPVRGGFEVFHYPAEAGGQGGALVLISQSPEQSMHRIGPPTGQADH